MLREDTPALHLTVETFDLFSSLRCARTYFLTRQVKEIHHITAVMNENITIDDYELLEVSVPYY